MANRKTDATRERNPGASIPSQEDEADILEEVGAVPDENGAFMADEESIRKIGAVDAESVRENRRRDDIVKKKRGNVANVPFNTGDVLDSYDTILRVFPTNQVEIRVKSLRTGATQTINSRPKSGAELYEALLLVHGQHEETEYEVSFVDSVRKGWLAKPRIVMPDMRPPAQQGQPMNQHPPQGYPPPGYPPPQYAPPGYPPQQPAPVQQQPPSAPVVQFTPPPAVDPMALMQQTFDLFQRMQASLQPPPQPYPYTQPPQQTVPAMPPPPQTNDPAVQAAWMKQAFDLFQQMQSALQRPAQQPQPQPQQPPQQTLAQAGPPGPPPRGMRWVWVHPYGFALEAEQSGVSQQERPMNPMFRDRRPPYDPHGDRSAPYTPQQPQPQQQRPMTLVEQLRESTASMRATVEAMQEINSMLPGYGGQESSAPEVDDDSPVQVIDWGPAKGVINKSDGSTRWGESLVANLPSVLKWVGEQSEQIAQRAERRQRQQAQHENRPPPPPRQLRPGEVEVLPGQQPPPGYAFVPVEEESLPPPPVHVPPPISAPRRTWDAPTTPEEGER